MNSIVRYSMDNSRPWLTPGEHLFVFDSTRRTYSPPVLEGLIFWCGIPNQAELFHPATWEVRYLR